MITRHFGTDKLLIAWKQKSVTNTKRTLAKRFQFNRVFLVSNIQECLSRSIHCYIHCIVYAMKFIFTPFSSSESSMFVSKRRWILKTCGTTTPLQCLEPLLQMAFDMGGYSEIEDLFYSRKNYKKPELQVSPHRGFEEEVAFLDQFFDDGRAYCLGSVNRDCWFLYTLNRRGAGEALVEDLTHNNNNMMIDSLQIPDPDQTIEVLMTDLDPDVMAIFSKEDSVDAKEATQVRIINFYLSIEP